MSAWPGTCVQRFLAALQRVLSNRRCGQRPPVFRRSSAVCRFVASLAVLASVSCHPGTDLFAKSRSRTPVTSAVKGLEISPEELRVRVRALVRPILGIIEENADRIIANTSDPAVRRGALVLKIEMTTTMLAALLRSDPVLALADAWGYTLQVENLLARPESQARYGQSAHMASEALALVEKQIRDLVASVQAGRFVESFGSNMRRWADRNPIGGTLHRRPSIDSWLAELLATSGGGGAFAVLGDLDETTADVMTRMDLYIMYLPRLARWEAELAADDLTRGVDPRTLSADFERLTRAVDRIAAVAEAAPDLAARERTAALDAVRGELLALLDTIHKERIAILHEVEAIAQRLGDRYGPPLHDAVRATVQRERIATLHEVEAIAQRLADRSGPLLHDAVQTEMKELLKTVEEMRKRLIVEAGEDLKGVIDHAFLRLVQLLLVCAGLVMLSLVLRALLLRRRERGRQTG